MRRAVITEHQHEQVSNPVKMSKDGNPEKQELRVFWTEACYVWGQFKELGLEFRCFNICHLANARCNWGFKQRLVPQEISLLTLANGYPWQSENASLKPTPRRATVGRPGSSRVGTGFRRPLCVQVYTGYRQTSCKQRSPRSGLGAVFLKSVFCSVNSTGA
jgi:hypothetical protein